MATIGICGIFAVIIAIMYLAVKPIGKFPEPPEPRPAPERPVIKEPRISEGLAYKWVTKTDAFGQAITTSCGYEVDEDHETTKEFRRLEKLKSLAMFGVVDGEEELQWPEDFDYIKMDKL